MTIQSKKNTDPIYYTIFYVYPFKKSMTNANARLTK